VHTDDPAEMTRPAATHPAAGGEAFLAVDECGDRRLLRSDHKASAAGHGARPGPGPEQVPYREDPNDVGYRPQRTFEETIAAAARLNRALPVTGDLGVPESLRPASGWVPAYLALAGIWGFSFLFIKVADHEFAPLQVAFGRVVLGCVVVLLISLPRRRHSCRPEVTNVSSLDGGSFGLDTRVGVPAH
jgi:hypothetical protein